MIDRALSSELYQQILQENVKLSVHDLKVGHEKRQRQHTHTSCSTKGWLEQKKVHILE